MQIETIVNEILAAIQPVLNSMQHKRLKEVLDVHLGSACVNAGGHESEGLLQAFLTAKKLEGCTERTLKYYEATLGHFVEAVDEPLTQVDTETLRGYLMNYQSTRNVGKVTTDNIVIGAMRVYFHRVVLAPCEGITRNTCFVLRPKSKVMREYALLTCFQPEAIEYANARSKGSTMPYAVWDNSFETYPVLIPVNSDLNRFSEQLNPMINRLQTAYILINELEQLRDALLPKFMTGEIDVSKVELP